MYEKHMIQIKVMLKFGMIQRNYFRGKVKDILLTYKFYRDHYNEYRKGKKQRNDILKSQHNKWL